MTAIDAILAGIEAELSLERELGVRVVEFDRALLATEGGATPTAAPQPRSTGHEARITKHEARSTNHEARSANHPIFDFVFLHHRAFDADENEMMQKIWPAMGKTPESAPVCTAPPLPRARIYIVMGNRARRLFFADSHRGPGEWFATNDGKDVLVTYSPEFLLRFDMPAKDRLRKKQELWLALKKVMQKAKSEK